MTLRKLAILGGGAVARALGPRLAQAGLEVCAWTRDPSASVAVGRPASLEELRGVDAAWILVSDRAIRPVCERLVAVGAPRVVLHGSGYFGTGVLGGAPARGVLHPLVSFPIGAAPDLAGAGASVSGDVEAREAAVHLASALGLEVFDLPDEPLARARYHAAASLSANGAAALFDLALEARPPGADRLAVQDTWARAATEALGRVAGEGPRGAGAEPRTPGHSPTAPGELAPLPPGAAAAYALLGERMLGRSPRGSEPATGAGDERARSLCVHGITALHDLALEVLPGEVDRGAAGRALAHLTSGVLRHAAVHGPAGALTGPVSRGDHEVVSGHLQVLPVEAVAVYRLLATRMLDLADLDSGQASAVRAVLGE